MGMFDFLKKTGSDKNHFETLREKAIQGDSNAQFEVAKFYDENSDFEESVKWLMLAVENNHNDAKHYLALDYFGGLGVKKDYEKAIQLSEDLLNNDNDLRGAKILGDIYSRNEPKAPFFNKYYNPEMAEKFYLEIMNSANPNYWLSCVNNLAMLYGGEYLYGNFYKSNVSNPLKAIYCFYLSYLEGDEEAMKDIEIISKKMNITITEVQLGLWEQDYKNIHCSI